MFYEKNVIVEGRESIRKINIGNSLAFTMDACIINPNYKYYFVGHATNHVQWSVNNMDPAEEYPKWTKWEEKILIKYKKKGWKYPQIQKEFLSHRTENALRTRAYFLNITNPKGWRTWEEWENWVIFLLKRYTNHNNQEIGKLINRSKLSVNNQASKIGLTIHPPDGDVPIKALETILGAFQFSIK